MISLFRFASRIVRRRSFHATSFSGRRYLINSSIKFSEALTQPNFDALTSSRFLIKNCGIRSHVMLPEERAVAFDSLWKKLLNDSNTDVNLINQYLHARLDSGLSLDLTTVLQSLSNRGFEADARTYGVFVLQSCLKGDMQETKKILQALKNANLEVDNFIFSCIMHGYIKAGLPEEMESTKAIMTKFGVWPSRVGYMGILYAYAGLGDVKKFEDTLNEAFENLHLERDRDQPLLALVGPVSSVKMVVALLLALPESEFACNDVLRFLPINLHKGSVPIARNGVLKLLVNRRSMAAFELFKRAEPNLVTDSYLVLVGRCILLANEDPHLLGDFFRISNIEQSRANMISRRIQITDNRRNRSNLPKFSTEDKSIEELYESAKSVDSSILAHVIVPRLLTLGVSPKELVETVQPTDIAQVAAFGCVFAHIFPDAGNPQNLEGAKLLCEDFGRFGYFPHRENLMLTFIRSAHMLRCLLNVAERTDTDLYENLTQTLRVLMNCVGPHSEKPLLLRLISHLYDNMCSRLSRKLDDTERRLLDTLIQYLISQNIRFHKDSWLFYALEHMGVTLITQQRLLSYEHDQNKVDVIIDHLEGSLQKDAVKA